MEHGTDIGDIVGEELKGGFHLRLDVVDYAAAVLLSVVDAQGEMEVAEIAPIVAYLYVLDPRARQLAHRVLRAVPESHINAVVVFSLFVLLPCGERGNGVCLHERVVAVVLARRVVVFIVSGEGEKKHPTVFFLGIVYPCRNKLNLLAVGFFIVIYDCKYSLKSGPVAH